MLSIYQLKPAFQNLLRPGVKRLYDKGVTANQVTLFAAVVSVLLGTLLLALPQHTWLFALIPLWMILRMALNHPQRDHVAGAGGLAVVLEARAFGLQGQHLLVGIERAFVHEHVGHHRAHPGAAKHALLGVVAQRHQHVGFAPAAHGARAFAQYPQVAQVAHMLGASGFLFSWGSGLAGWSVAVGVAGPVANQLLQPAVHGVGFGIHHFGLLGGWGLAIQSASGVDPVNHGLAPRAESSGGRGGRPPRLAQMRVAPAVARGRRAAGDSWRQWGASNRHRTARAPLRSRPS